MVYLVGAGPGDADLITVKGLKALQKADVVLYDRLVGASLLDEAPTRAVRINVGKAPKDPMQTRQDQINEMLVRYGREEDVVVRLKGGDPFVFGRGGEEALALKDAGVPYEVIPGVSSSISVPAAAGIPVTHRGVSNAFAVFTGHEAEENDGIPWDAAARIPTAVFLMGVEKLPIIVRKLVQHGRSPETPVALVSRGTLPDQRVVRGTLRDILERADGVPSPAVIVVGDVVNVLGRSLQTAGHALDYETLLVELR